ncbi:hypothetical protein GXE18_24355 [Salmonella enterica]|nr:hypothetical protein [Salmonella enterica]EEH8549857.1 hypothetical protein [Salmonella enterica]
MEVVLKVLALILEMTVQAVKTHSDDERQQRIDYARNNPADYLRRFGRVRVVDPDTGSESVRSRETED